MGFPLVHILSWPCMRSARTDNPSHGPVDKSSVASLHNTLTPRTVHQAAMAPTRISYTNEFKMKTVEIAKQVGNRPAADQLGINECNVRRWRQEMKALSQATKNSTSYNVQEVSCRSEVLHRYYAHEHSLPSTPSFCTRP